MSAVHKFLLTLVVLIVYGLVQYAIGYWLGYQIGRTSERREDT